MRGFALMLGLLVTTFATTALADDAPPASESEPSPQATARASGMRLALDLSFARAAGDLAGRLNAGSPSLIPIGADVSWRTSKKFLLGLHGFAALASRDNCLGDTGCTAQDYGLGAHFEHAFTVGTTFVPYLRYGVGWEMLHQSGMYKNGDAYVYRHALDLIDARLGGDFVLARREDGRATRIGPFIGMIAGLDFHEIRGGTTSTSSIGGESGHVWFLVGARATMDP